MSNFLRDTWEGNERTTAEAVFWVQEMAGMQVNNLHTVAVSTVPPPLGSGIILVLAGLF